MREEYLTYKQLSVITGLSVGYLRNLVYKGMIPVYKPFGRPLFKLSEIESIIENSRIPSVYEIVNNRVH